MKIKVKTTLKQMMYEKYKSQYKDYILNPAINLTLENIEYIKIPDDIDAETTIKYLFEDLQLELLYNIESVINEVLDSLDTDLIQ